MQLSCMTVDGFNDRRFCGNPLAVVLVGLGLATQQMQSIAAEFNLAETTFVLPPKDPAHTAEVRIFTPRAELPFAGHPNIGTAFVLAQRDNATERVVNDPMLFEEKAGLVRLDLVRDGTSVVGARLTRHNLSCAARVSPWLSLRRRARSALTISRRSITAPALRHAVFPWCLPN